VIDDLHGAIFGRASPFRPSLVSEQLETMQELLVGLSVGISCTTYTNVLKQTQVLNLIATESIVKRLWLLESVGANATNVMRVAGHQCVHERRNLFL